MPVGLGYQSGLTRSNKFLYALVGRKSAMINTTHLWKDFIENPKNIQEETDNGTILIMMFKGIRPLSIFQAIKKQKPTKEMFERYGYVFEGDKLKRTGRFFWSKEMQKIAEWADKWDIQYSFDIQGETFLDSKGIYIQLKGPWNDKIAKEFPVGIAYIQVH